MTVKCNTSLNHYLKKTVIVVIVKTRIGSKIDGTKMPKVISAFNGFGRLCKRCLCLQAIDSNVLKGDGHLVSKLLSNGSGNFLALFFQLVYN